MAKHPAELMDTKPHAERVVIRSYPKVVVYYPTMIVAFLCAIWTWIGQDGGDFNSIPIIPGRIFILVFFFNTLTIAFDFTRIVFVAMVLAFALLITGFFLLESYDIQIFGAISDTFAWFDLRAGAGFFAAFGFMFIFIFFGVFVQTRFNFWEVKHNELIHHHGIAGDIDRFPAPNLRMSKEITDVFEYALLFSGRLVLYPATSDRPIILDHVVRINAIEKRVEKMLQTLQVHIEGPHNHAPPPAAPPPAAPPAG
ncbi:MAG: hypothetical protein P1V97_19925 [Planctomycetota bacterium]|nr:hypothetical protein [Planctomycetota bacterium]